ncbi:hypothetical protein O181_018543 [Austropuccinia psidii MF-1]|uniref:Actin cytoskeleton-regulatory complex protein SLA1 n=1 Tax=Austropuccinia psidii MF-1 TaxID=1389203 RepID=A0A9Q3C9A2_9BASI|nr:hypothetical protein [Austropuccinia psidii MF-1]
MASSVHLALFKAEYAYTPQTDDEIALEEEALYYLLDDQDKDWHKVKLKTPPTSVDPSPIGLVPANYILPAPVLRPVVALYQYDAQTDDELTIHEDEQLNLYEEDGEWSLVGRHSLNGSRGVGYVPTTYIESVASGSTTVPYVEEIQPDSSNLSIPTLPQPPLANPSTETTSGLTDVVTWDVIDIDHKKKKRKGLLSVGNGLLIFDCESDKSAQQQYPLSTVTIAKTEKGKHLILHCGTDERRFHVSSKDLNDIISKIQHAPKDSQLSSINPASAPKLKTPGSSSVYPSPALRPPSAMASPDRPPAQNGRKVSFATPVGKPATALYDFEAQGDDELTVEEGDRLYVLDDVSDDDWWKCAKHSNGQEGVVPASYIELDEGQPSGNPEAADAAMTAAAAEDAKKRRIQEEQDARLAQQLAEEDQSEFRMENAKAADRKLSLAREAEQHKILEAEAAARRKRDSETRSIQRRDAERAMASPGSFAGPIPPKLTTRPDSAQGHLSGSGSTSASPRRLDSAPREGRSKPQGLIRTWRDRTAQFKVEAEFRGLQNGKIRLHKLNGVVIEVPLSKMSTEDVIWLEGATGRTLRTDDPDEVPLANLVIGANRATPPPTQNPPKRPNPPPKPTVDWFEFFLNAGCDLDDCTRYATNFERDRIDENLLVDLEPGTMRNLGLREGDVIRVRKHIKQKYNSADDSASKSKAEQIKKDEELARKLQDQDVTSAPNIFTNGPNGSLKTTRRGRPTPSKTGSATVDASSFSSAKETLIDAPEPVSAPSLNSTLVPALSPSPAISSSGGFDDNAWQVRPNSTTPVVVTPQAPSPQVASSSAVDPTNIDATSADDSKPSLTDEIFQKIMNHSKQGGSAPPQPAPATPAIPPPVTVSHAALNPNGPRGPLAPVASNAPLLNPLVPVNSGMIGFVPTRPSSVQPQPTGLIGQTIPSMQSFVPSIAMQQTGVGLNHLRPPTIGMIQSQPTGIIQSQPIGMIQSQPTGIIQSQPVSMLQPQPTGINQLSMMQPQVTGFNPTFSPMAPPPMPSIPSMYAASSLASSSAPPKSFNPSDIFNQMKSGQFAKDPNLAPQAAGKYDALRPQPTGFLGAVGPSTTSNFAQQFMPNQQQEGHQQLQPQPTGFAQGGYVTNQPTGMPMQNMFSQTQQQWRGF